MELVVASHPAALRHDTSRNHPERPDRVNSARAGLIDAGLTIVDITSPLARREDLELIHEPSYIDMLEAFCKMGGGALDMDTIVSSDSWEAALAAVGGVLSTIEELDVRSDATGFVLARPPGHHAMADRAMGFCMFNNVAIAARWLTLQGKRVAILDWDVHHGNGTEASLGDDPAILYVSLHQSPFYPFEGNLSAIEKGAAPGSVINIPLPEGTGGDVYREAWSTVVLPALKEFGPDWVLVSAGYDAHHLDHLAGMRLISADYGWLAESLGREHPASRIVFVLEGGYDLDGIRESVAATIRGVTGIVGEASPFQSPSASWDALGTARRVIGQYFSLSQ